MEVNEELMRHAAAHFGRKGGQSKSPAKMAALELNRMKALTPEAQAKKSEKMKGNQNWRGKQA